MAASCRWRACFRARSPTRAELWVAGNGSAKVSGIYRMLGKDQTKLASAEEGETAALGKLDEVDTGATLSTVKGGIEPLATLESRSRSSPSRSGRRSARTR